MRPSINYTLTSQWNGGYVMEVFITNPGSQTLHDYQVGFDLPGTVTDVWGGTLTAHDDDNYMVADDDGKNDIAPGETVRFKFKALTEDGELPSGFTVNGQPASVNGKEPAQDSTPASQAPAKEDAVSPQSAPSTADDDVIHVDPAISAAELEALIAEAPTGATIQLAAGEYRFDDSITITRSDIALVGVGSDATTIVFTDKALASDDDHGFYVAGSNTQFAGYLRHDADEGSNTLALKGDHGLSVGDTVRIWQDNTQTYYDEIGDTSWQKDNAPLRTSMAQVVAVDGDSVTLDRGVHFDFEGGETKVQQVDALENVALQGFSIQYDLGTPDKATFSNTRSDLKDYQAVKFDGTVNGSVTDVQVINGPSTAFEFALSLGLNVDGAQAHGAFNKGSGGNGYAYELRESYDGSFANLEDSGMRHSMLFASWRSSVGNDIHVKSTDRDINFHGGQDRGNTVRVEQSIRDANADGMSTTLWINSGGESFGAITRASANQVTFDYVVGSKRDDVLQGSDDGVYLNGALGYDTLYGGAGDDILNGGGGWGSNRLDGGDGFDTALFDEAFDNYKIRFNDDGSVYIDGSSNDTLVNIEQAIFADGTILDTLTRSLTQGDKPNVPTMKDILQKGIKTSKGRADEVSETVDEIKETVDDVMEAIQDFQKAPVAAPDLSEAETPVDTAPISATVALETVSQWSSGYVVRVTITNTSAETIDDPQIAFTLGADVDTLYGASLLERDGDIYTIARDGSDAFKPGETLTFSLKAYAPHDVQPQVVALNGAALEQDAPGVATSAPLAEAPQDDAPAAEPVAEADPLSATVALETVSQWSSGYVVRLKVTNTSSEAIDDPQISFTLGADVDTLYGASLLERDGDTYTIAHDGDDTLEAGESLTFSLKAYAPHDVQPQVVAINGQALDTQAPSEQATPPGAEELTYEDLLVVTSNITREWSKGYVAEVFVENTSDAIVILPTVSFELPGDIAQVWNGQLADTDEGYSVTAINGGKELDPGEVWRFSYKMRGEDHSLPSDMAIDLVGVEALHSGDLVA